MFPLLPLLLTACSDYEPPTDVVSQYEICSDGAFLCENINDTFAKAKADYNARKNDHQQVDLVVEKYRYTNANKGFEHTHITGFTVRNQSPDHKYSPLSAWADSSAQYIAEVDKFTIE